jgi:hypothetical protein
MHADISKLKATLKNKIRTSILLTLCHSGAPQASPESRTANNAEEAI